MTKKKDKPKEEETKVEEAKVEPTEEEKIHLTEADIDLDDSIKEEPTIADVIKEKVDQHWKGELSALKSRIMLLEIINDRLRRQLDKHGIKE